MIVFPCPGCGADISAGEERAGTLFVCPSCRIPQRVPRPDPHEPLPAPRPPRAGGSSPRSPRPGGRESGSVGTLVTHAEQFDAFLAGEEAGPREIKLRRGREEEARRVLTEHFKRVPGHALADFGDAVAFERVEEYRVHHVRVDSLYETRQVARRVRPHAGEALPACRTTEANIDPWAFDNPPPDEFKDGTQELTIPDSQRVCDCTGCRGKGTLTCSGCSGGKVVPCSSCRGDKQVACGRCGGSGRYREQMGTDTITENCTSCAPGGSRFNCLWCKGTGQVHRQQSRHQVVACTCNSGKVPCAGCQGHGRVKCAGCGGRGVVGCGSCREFGKTVAYLAVVRTFTSSTASRVAGEGVPTPALKEMARSATLDRAVELVTTGLPDAAEPESGNPALNLAVGRLLRTASEGTPDGGRVARVRLALGASHALKLTYSHGGGSYALWLLGEEMTVFAPESPLTEAMGEKVREAVELWNGGQERKAALALRDALDMAETDADCRAAYDELSGEVPRPLRERGEQATTLRRWVKQNPVLVVVLLVLLAPLLLSCVGGLGFIVLTGPRDRRSDPPPEWADRGSQVADTGPPRPLDRPGPGERTVNVGFVSYEVFLETGQTGKLTVSIDRYKSERYNGELMLVFEAPASLTVPARVKVEKGQLEVEVPITAGTKPGRYEVRVVPEGVKRDPLATDRCTVTVAEPLKPPVPKAPPADRAAAEMVLRLGGSAGVVPAVGGPVVVRPASSLPPGEFRLTAVGLPGTKVTDADLAALAGCRHLKVLDLTRTGVGDAGMEHLAGLTSLEELALGVTKVTDAGVARLAGLTSMRVLHLPHTGLTDAGLKHLTGMTELRFLSLHDTAVSNAGLPVLRGLPRLAEVRLGNTKVPPAEAERLREFLSKRAAP